MERGFLCPNSSSFSMVGYRDGGDSLFFPGTQARTHRTPPNHSFWILRISYIANQKKSHLSFPKFHAFIPPSPFPSPFTLHPEQVIHRKPKPPKKPFRSLGGRGGEKSGAWACWFGRGKLGGVDELIFELTGDPVGGFHKNTKPRKRSNKPNQTQSIDQKRGWRRIKSSSIQKPKPHRQHHGTVKMRCSFFSRNFKLNRLISFEQTVQQ